METAFSAVKPQLRERLYRRRHLVPNIVTLGNMFCGFLTIVYSTSGRFEKAAVAIAFAILLDGLDGRVARHLNATSKFGVEFDSFSDLVSFGVGPAILVYNWCFRVPADELGVLFTFAYTLCAACRLARFNVADPNPKGFVGMPTPGAAAMVAATVHFAPQISPSWWNVLVGALLMTGLAYLMVSKIPFWKLGKVRRRALQLFEAIFAGIIIALIWYNDRIGFLVLAASYVLSGPLVFLYSQNKKAKAPQAT